MQFSQETGKVIWYSHLLKKIDKIVLFRLQRQAEQASDFVLTYLDTALTGSDWEWLGVTAVSSGLAAQK